MAPPPTNLPQATMPGGTRAGVLYKRDSFRGNLEQVGCKKDVISNSIIG
jgi:hypothetical protein